MYNYSVLIHKQEFVPTMPYFIILTDCCDKNQCVINFTSDDMISKFEVFTNNKLDIFCLTEIMRK